MRVDVLGDDEGDDWNDDANTHDCKEGSEENEKEWFVAEDRFIHLIIIQ